MHRIRRSKHVYCVKGQLIKLLCHFAQHADIVIANKNRSRFSASGASRIPQFGQPKRLFLIMLQRNIEKPRDFCPIVERIAHRQKAKTPVLIRTRIMVPAPLAGKICGPTNILRQPRAFRVLSCALSRRTISAFRTSPRCLRPRSCPRPAQSPGQVNLAALVLNAMLMRSSSDRLILTRCKSHDGKISRSPVTGGITMAWPVKALKLPTISPEMV